MKRRFEFRLERVRLVRALEERVARAERATAENLARAAEARADRARGALERSRAWLAEILRGRIDARSVLLSQRALDAELRALERSVETSRTLHAQAERLAGAHRSKKSAARALEELRERFLARHRATLEQVENRALDEAALRARERRSGRAGRETDSRSTAPGSDASSPSPHPSRSQP